MENLPPTGKLDADTRAKLTLDAPLLTNYVVTTNDLARLQPLGKTWLAKSQQTALDYETELELVAEKSHSHPLLIEKLNPNVNWTNLAAGHGSENPRCELSGADEQGGLCRSSTWRTNFWRRLMSRQICLRIFRAASRRTSKSGRSANLHVVVVIPNPNYTVDPELFPESPELQSLGHKLILPPGPNNPVGVAWIGLDKTGYGIHGTPAPEQIGRTESHGCFRLANWDAEYLMELAWVGMPVLVEP